MVIHGDLGDDVRPPPMMPGRKVEFGRLSQLSGFCLKLAMIQADGLFAREMGSPGITPQRYSMLEVIGQNPGLQQVQLATALGVSGPATTLTLNFWEDRQCIERRKRKEDRRSFDIHATERGLQELDRLHAIIRQADIELTSRLTEAETIELRRLLKKIHA